MSLILDIETIPDVSDKGYVAYKSVALSRKGLKDPEKIETAKAEAVREKFALSPLTGKILCCGLMSDVDLDEAPLGSMLEHPSDEGKENIRLIYYDIVWASDEAVLLNSILHTMQRYLDNGHRIVTYNGNKFDIPFIVKRAILLGIPHPANFPTLAELTSQYTPRHHLDLMAFLGERDPFTSQAKYASLTEWGYKVGATTELTSNSNMVYEWFLTNETEKIKQHCLADIVKTYLLYEKVKGWASGYEYN